MIVANATGCSSIYNASTPSSAQVKMLEVEVWLGLTHYSKTMLNLVSV